MMNQSGEPNKKKAASSSREAVKSPSQASARRVVTQKSTVMAGPAAGKVGPAVSEERIRELAYHKWEAAGQPNGDGVGFWLQAEQELVSGM